MKKTIFHDVLLGFGKYKREPVNKVLADDPGYFLWLRESGTYLLDEVIESYIEIWETTNIKEASRVRGSAKCAAIERALAATPIAVDEIIPRSVIADVSLKSRTAPETPANWGTW